MSNSRIAQENLTELEKRSAPFKDQLHEAWKFIGISPGSPTQSKAEADDSKRYGGFLYHGREEWLLRWLLKKLQSQKDKIPR